MANLKEIRRRIASVKGTQKITRAMKMVAAAKLRKAQEQAENFREYSKLTSDVLAGVASDADDDSHPLLERREQKKALVLEISSDRGLCGGFNSNLNRLVAERLKLSDVPVSLSVVGKKAKSYFEHRNVEVQRYYADVFDDLNYDAAAAIAQELAALYAAGEYDSISLAYNEMVSVVSQVPKVVPLLPLALPEKKADDAKDIGPAGFVFEPEKKALLSILLPKYVEIKVFGALLESLAAEHAARMSAMETATNNAQDMIDSLTLVYNRARQTAITSELMDIVGGAEALND
ncbi:MAG: ATP synthase F1 subunit gamma [Deltaproteobacteria bacterium]|nr:ATP synthase F1 subunit gamma [Deltaproteobacteria bacterium]MBN2672946.1 ATP synthase F1 subunit gamma [Deltaproteobacteria bacterium]